MITTQVTEVLYEISVKNRMLKGTGHEGLTHSKNGAPRNMAKHQAGYKNMGRSSTVSQSSHQCWRILEGTIATSLTGISPSRYPCMDSSTPVWSPFFAASNWGYSSCQGKSLRDSYRCSRPDSGISQPQPLWHLGLGNSEMGAIICLSSC